MQNDHKKHFIIQITISLFTVKIALLQFSVVSLLRFFINYPKAGEITLHKINTINVTKQQNSAHNVILMEINEFTRM